MKKLNIVKKLVNLSFVLLVVSVSCTRHREEEKNTTISTFPLPTTATPIPTQTSVPIFTITPNILSLIPTDSVFPEIPVPTSTPFSADEELDVCSTNGQEENQKERILFTASWDGDNEIYAIQSDGSSIQQLTDNQIQDVAPLAAPDGQKIAYISFAELNTEKRLYVLNTGLPLTNPILIGVSFPFGYTWDPDSKQLAFASGDDISVVDLTDLSYTNLTRGTVLFSVNDLSWSPNNDKIVFAESMDSAGGIWHIRLITLDKFVTQWLPSVAYRDLEPIWHPQEDSILFVSKLLPGYVPEQLYLTNSDGTGLKQLTNSETYKSGISWSPNGKLIAYLATHWDFETETGPYVINYAIHLLSSDGNNDTTVFESAEFLTASSWSPSNRYLAFLAEEGGVKNLYVANLCQNETIRVVENVASYAPVWIR